MDEEDANGRDVVPPLVGRLLGLSWIVLFAGRWTVLQLLLAAGVISPSALADLDDRVLVRCYLVLLAITITVVALRAVRSAQARREPNSVSPGQGAACVNDADHSGAVGRRPEAGD